MRNGVGTGGHRAVYVTTRCWSHAPVAMEAALPTPPSPHSSVPLFVALLCSVTPPGWLQAAQCHGRAAGAGGGIPVHHEPRARPLFGPMNTEHSAHHSPPGLRGEGGSGRTRNPRTARDHFTNHAWNAALSAARLQDS